MPWRAADVGIQRVRVVEVLARQVGAAEQRVVHRLFVEIDVLRVVVGEVHLPLEEDLAAAGAGFAVGAVPQRVVRTEALGRLAAAHAAGHVVFLVDHVVPERFDGALVVGVVRFHRDVRHSRVVVHRAHGVPDGLVLLGHRQVALVVFLAFAIVACRVVAAVEQEFGEFDVLRALAAALHVVHEAAEAHQRLLHFLVAVVPRLLGRRAQVGAPAVGQLLGRVVQAGVLLVGHQVVIDGRFQKVARGVAFVIAAPFPVRERAGVDVASRVYAGQRECRLQIAVRLLRGQDFGNPVFQRGAHFLVRLDDFRVALRVDHQSDAHRLHGLVHPGVGEHVSLVRAVRLAAQLLCRLRRNCRSRRALLQVVTVDLIDAMRNPTHHQGLGSRAPQRAVDFEILGVDRIELLRRRRRLHRHVQGGGTLGLPVVHGQPQHVGARRREGRGGDQRLRVGELDFARAGILGPRRGGRRPGRAAAEEAVPAVRDSGSIAADRRIRPIRADRFFPEVWLRGRCRRRPSAPSRRPKRWTESHFGSAGVITTDPATALPVRPSI